jgi:hypothetical protein
VVLFAEDSLPDILGRLEGVLTSLKTYLEKQEEQNEAQAQIEANKGKLVSLVL